MPRTGLVMADGDDDDDGDRKNYPNHGRITLMERGWMLPWGKGEGGGRA